MVSALSLHDKTIASLSRGTRSLSSLRPSRSVSALERWTWWGKVVGVGCAKVVYILLTSNCNYRITSNVSSKHDKGFRDDDLVHVELRGKSSVRQRPRGRQRIVHVDNE